MNLTLWQQDYRTILQNLTTLTLLDEMLNANHMLNTNHIDGEFTYEDARWYAEEATRQVRLRFSGPVGTLTSWPHDSDIEEALYASQEEKKGW